MAFCFLLFIYYQSAFSHLLLQFFWLLNKWINEIRFKRLHFILPVLLWYICQTLFDFKIYIINELTYVYGEMMSTVILVNVYHLVLICPQKKNSLFLCIKNSAVSTTFKYAIQQCYVISIVLIYNWQFIPFDHCHLILPPSLPTSGNCKPDLFSYHFILIWF